jgi:2-isopropylmalate synthase
MLTRIGLKEIEVAFPAASDTDLDFVRQLITEQRIPDDMTIEVLTQARPELIQRTIASLKGARRAIVHLYNPIAPHFRRIVFAKSRRNKANCHRRNTTDQNADRRTTGNRGIFEYSPETFSMAELDFSKEICDAVSEIWQATPERKIIINLPGTVESSTPNIYADQIEWMHRHLTYRSETVPAFIRIMTVVLPLRQPNWPSWPAPIVLKLPCSENGERTGNVDLVTLALNLYTRHIPQLDFLTSILCVSVWKSAINCRYIRVTLMSAIWCIPHFQAHIRMP